MVNIMLIFVFQKNSEGKKVLDWWKNRCFYQDLNLKVKMKFILIKSTFKQFSKISNDVNIFKASGILI